MLSVDEKLSDVDGIGLGRKGTIDRPQYLRAPFWTVDTLFYMTPKSNFEILFLYSIVQKINWKKMNEASGVPSLSKTTIESVVQFYPSKKEQEKLGLLIRIVTETILLQQRQLDLYKKLKRGLLQKLFPKDGEKVPEVRFADFHDYWEQRTLEDIAKVNMGQSPKSSNYTTNPSDHILVQGNTDIVNGWVKPRIWTTQITKLAKKGDILLSVRAPVGDVSKTSYDIVIGRGIAAISKDEYIFQYLKKIRTSGYWNKITTGSTFESISSDDIRNLNIPITVIEEKKKISNILKITDNQTLLQQNKLKELKLLKKYLLQNLFI